jgi:hypothetical protein
VEKRLSAAIRASQTIITVDLFDQELKATKLLIQPSNKLRESPLPFDRIWIIKQSEQLLLANTRAPGRLEGCEKL